MAEAEGQTTYPKLLLALTGMSESGKSTVGRYLAENGIARLKIADFLRIIYMRERQSGDFDEWAFAAEEQKPEWYMRKFVKELQSYLEGNSVEYASIESLYGPRMATALHKHFEDRFVLVYVDAPREVRLQRQVSRKDLSSLEEAKLYLDPRDALKTQKGVPELKHFNGQVEILDNAGPIERLYAQIDSLLQRRGVKNRQSKEAL